MKYDFNIDMLSDNSLSLILREIKPNSNILEFGPAKGYMSAYMKLELGCKVYGVEVDADSAKIAEEYVEKMIVCDAETLVWKNEIPIDMLFDHIIFADVLEHLRDPLSVLKEACMYLKPKGTILTSIPNIGHSAVIMELLKGKFEYRSLGLLDNTHIRFFTRESVQSLISEAGLTPIKWKTTNMLPEQTELQHDYSSVPYEVSEFLKSKKDSHVYQYITVSGKASEFTSENVESENNSYVLSEYAQIFWAKDSNYSEESSLKLPLNTNEVNFKSYQFNIPGLFLQYPLRMDLTNFKSIIELTDISLQNQQGLIIKNWSANEIIKETVVIHELYKLDFKDKCIFFAYGDDPQLILNLKSRELKDEDYVININMNFSNDFERVNSVFADQIGYLMNEIIVKNSDLRNIGDELIIKENELLNIRKETEILGDKLVEKDIALSQLINEINLLNVKLEAVENFNIELLNSRSWKLTKPFRWIINVTRGVTERK